MYSGKIDLRSNQKPLKIKEKVMSHDEDVGMLDDTELHQSDQIQPYDDHEDDSDGVNALLRKIKGQNNNAEGILDTSDEEINAKKLAQEMQQELEDEEETEGQESESASNHHPTREMRNSQKK